MTAPLGSSRLAHSILAASIATLLGSSLSTPPARATGIWNGGGNPDGSWSNAANWDTLPTDGGTLTFDGALNLGTNNDLLTSSGVITFNSGAGPFTLAGNALSLSGDIIDNSPNAQTISLSLDLTTTINMNVATGSALTISGPLIDFGGLSKIGNGTLTLSGANTYSGPTTIGSATGPGGTLIVAATGKLGSGLLAIGGGANTGNLILNNDSTVSGFTSSTNSSTAANTLAIASGKTLTVLGNASVGGITLNGAVTSLTTAGGGALAITGSFIVGNAAFDDPGLVLGTTFATADLSGLGQFTFSGSSTTSFNVSGATIANSNRGKGTLILANTSNTITAPTITIGGNSPTQQSNGTLDFGGGTNVLNADTINIGVTKGVGTVTWLPSTTTGSLTIRGQAGGSTRATIVIGNRSGGGSTIPPVSSVALNGHLVDILASSLTIGLVASSTANGSFSFDSGTVDVSALSLGIKTGGNVANGTLTIGGTGLLKVGSGGLILTNGTTTTGTLTINGGTVQTNSDMVKGAITSGVAKIELLGGTLDLLDTDGSTRHSIGTLGAPINTLTFGSGTLKNVSEINGGGAITKTNGGTLILEGTNTYTGSTTIAAGTLQIGTGGATGTPGGGNISNGSILSFNRSGTLSVGNIITDLVVNNVATPGAVQLNGAGTITLTGASTYTGGTTINAGTLSMTPGSLASTGGVLINSGGTLAGTGDGAVTGFVGNVTMTAGSNVHPGATGADNDGGTLTMSTLTVGGGDFRLDVGSDLINVNGLAHFTGASTISPTTSVSPGTYLVLQAGTLSIDPGFTPMVNQVPGGRLSFALSLSPANSISLNVTGTVGNLVWKGSIDAGGGAYVWDINNTLNWKNGAVDDRFFDGDIVTFNDTGIHKTVTINSSVAPSSVTVTNSVGNDYTFTGSGGIVGTTGLTKSGAGTLILGATNTFTGTTAVQNGTLKPASAAALPATSVVSLGSGATSGVLDLNGLNVNVGGLATSGTGTGNNIGNSSTSADATLVFAGGTSTFSGKILDTLGSGTGKTSLSVSSGALTLTGANTYTGTTALNGGTLTFSSLNNLGNGTAIDFNGGTLQYASGAGNVDLSISNVTLNAGGGTIDTNGNNVTFANPIGNSGTGGLTKTGNGTLTLISANTYTGSTTINGGTLTLGASELLSDTGGLTSNGGTFDMNGNSETVGTVTLSGGSIVGAGSILTGTSFAAQSGTVSAVLNGFTAALTKTTAGTLTLSGVNTYGGDTILDGGTLAYTVDNAVQGLTFGAIPASTNTSALDLSAANLTASTLTARTKSVTANTVNVGSGKTLTVSSTTNVGGLTADSVSTNLTFSGNGALSLLALTVGNTSASANAPTDSTMSFATLDLSALSSFTVNGGAVSLGVGNRTAGVLNLAAVSNTINTSTFSIGTGGTNQGGIGRLNLGAGTNVINASAINVGIDKSTASVQWLPATTTGSVKIRGAGGTDADRANITIGSRSQNGGAAATSTVILDGHPADILAGALLIGRNTNTSTGQGLFSFDTGTVDVTGIQMAVRSNGTANGTLTVGGTGLLNVGNGGFTLADSNGTATGILNINGGTVQTASDIAEGITNGNGGNSSINLRGGVLDLMGHNIGSAVGPINILDFETGTLKNVNTINDTGGVTKSTSGTLILDGINNYTGGNVISDGTLKVGNVTALGAATGSLTMNGGVLDLNATSPTVGALSGFAGLITTAAAGPVTLTVGDSSSTQFDGIIEDGSGTMSFTKQGAGTLALTGANTYSGLTTVSGGTLLVNNTVGSGTGIGSVAVSINGTLGGIGVIQPAGINNITVGALDVIAPGAGIGTLTIDSQNTAAASVLSLSSGAKFVYELNTSFQSDLLALINGSDGDIHFSNNTIDFVDLSPGNTLDTGNYTLFTASGSFSTGPYSGLTVDANNLITGGLSIGTLSGAYIGSLRLSGNDIVLALVPEPSTFAILLGGLGILIGSRKRRPTRTR